MPETDSEFLTLKEVCALVGVKRTAVKGAIDRGELRARRIGRLFRIQRGDVDGWLDACVVQPTV